MRASHTAAATDAPGGTVTSEDAASAAGQAAAPPDAHQQGIDCSDYRFVYLGPQGSWTPLHADVLRSYSWSANVCGRKVHSDHQVPTLSTCKYLCNISALDPVIRGRVCPHLFAGIALVKGCPVRWPQHRRVTCLPWSCMCAVGAGGYFACTQRWCLLHPQYTHLLYDRFKHEMASSFDLDAGTAARFPNLQLAKQLMIECIQVSHLLAKTIPYAATSFNANLQHISSCSWLTLQHPASINRTGRSNGCRGEALLQSFVHAARCNLSSRCMCSDDQAQSQYDEDRAC